MESFDIQAFTYRQGHGLLTELAAACTGCGGWVLDRRTLSPNNIELRIEIQLRAVLDFYAALLAAGVEVTRSGHGALTELCTRSKHLRFTAELGQIVALRLELAFLDEISLHSLLAAGSCLA